MTERPGFKAVVRSGNTNAVVVLNWHSPFVLFRATLHWISSGADRLAGIHALRFFVSEEQHLALPHLYGAPAYSRPPRVVEQVARPFDPDELPIEADRTDQDALALAELAGNSWAPAVEPTPKAHKRVRLGRAARNAAPSDQAKAVAVSVGVAAAPAGREDPNEQPSLEGRPFRLRSLGRIFGSDQK